ncbi:hypothetical protein LCM19_03860 [Qipengyuania flava]|nr:hypothetical protein [Qipengyuania flava]
MPDDHELGHLPAWANLVLAYANDQLADPLRDLIAFDLRLTNVFAQIKEPALAQIRLAWWREQFKHAIVGDLLSPPDPLLASLLQSWSGHYQALMDLIDGWEEILVGSSEDTLSLSRFEEANGLAFSSLARMAESEQAAADAAVHGRLWGRAKLLQLGLERGSETHLTLPRMPNTLRSLFIIGGLSRRAIFRGGQPLMGDRFSPIVGMRLGLLGV